MTIEQRHFDEAERMMPRTFSEHSAPYLEGYRYALAWHLAGKPAPTPERSRATACVYESGTAERDAWDFGWGNGFRHGERIAHEEIGQ